MLTKKLAWNREIAVADRGQLEPADLARVGEDRRRRPRLARGRRRRCREGEAAASTATPPASAPRRLSMTGHWLSSRGRNSPGGNAMHKSAPRASGRELASRVMSIEPFSSFEIGQISLAFCAAARKASSVGARDLRPHRQVHVGDGEAAAVHRPGDGRGGADLVRRSARRRRGRPRAASSSRRRGRPRPAPRGWCPSRRRSAWRSCSRCRRKRAALGRERPAAVLEAALPDGGAGACSSMFLPLLERGLAARRMWFRPPDRGRAAVDGCNVCPPLQKL